MSDNSKSEMKMEATKMIADGFLMGTIHTSTAKGDCPVTIMIEDKTAPYFLDPINLTDEYKNKGEKIWLKFRGLRQMNRCKNATPIEITEIQKRN